MRRIELPLIEYIESRCKWVGECFEWQGSKPNGYGIFMIPGTRKMAQAHRALYIEVHGPIAPGLLVQHSCDNPACCNIKHLSADTPLKNVRDSVAKGRKLHSGFNPKLTGEDHVKIKELSKTNSDFKVACMFGVTPSTIRRIRSGKTKAWKPGEVSKLASDKRWAAHRERKAALLKKKAAAIRKIKG